MFKPLLLVAVVLLLSTEDVLGQKKQPKSNSGPSSPEGAGGSTPKLGEEYNSLLCQIQMRYDQGCLSFLLWDLLNEENGALKPLFEYNSLLGGLLGPTGSLCDKTRQLLQGLLGDHGTVNKLLAKGGTLNSLLGYTKEGQKGALSPLVCFLLGNPQSLLGGLVSKLVRALAKSLLKSLAGKGGALTGLLGKLVEKLLAALKVTDVQVGAELDL